MEWPWSLAPEKSVSSKRAEWKVAASMAAFEKSQPVRSAWSKTQVFTFMAPLLANDQISDLGQRVDARLARNDGKRRHGSGSDLDVNNAVLGGQAQAFLRAGLEAELNGLPDVDKRLLARSALADTTRDERTLGDDPTVLTWREHHGKPHDVSVPPGT